MNYRPDIFNSSYYRLILHPLLSMPKLAGSPVRLLRLCAPALLLGLSTVLLILPAPGQSPVVATIPVGANPYGMAISPTGRYVYVANQTTNTVSVINTANYTVKATYAAGSNPPALVTNLTGRYLYVLDYGSDTISLLTAPTGALKETLTGVGSNPNSLAISPNGEVIYITNTGTTASPGSVLILHTKTNRISASQIELGQYLPIVVAFTPNGTHAYVANTGSNSVSVIDTSKNKVVRAPITVGTAPGGITFTPNGEKAYIDNYGDLNTDSGGSVSVIDIATATVTKTIATATGTSQSAVTPDGNYLFVPLQGYYNAMGNTVIVIDTATDSIVGQPILVGNEPGFIVITSDGKYAYVSNLYDGTVSVIDVNAAIAINLKRGGAH